MIKCVRPPPLTWQCIRSMSIAPVNPFNSLKRRYLSGGSLPSTLKVTCHPGLENILSNELSALGLSHEPSKYSAIVQGASIRDIFKCHLWLGSATNILVPVGQPFSARGLAELRRKSALLPWSEMVLPNARLGARVSTQKSKLYHSVAVEARVVAGAYEALGFDVPPQQTKIYKPAGIDEKEAPEVQLDIRVDRDLVQIYLNTSMTPLHRRGYRLQTTKAPLREDIAFATVYGSGWVFPTNQQHDSSDLKPPSFDTFLDPMCGSGTIAIEASGIAARLPPGRLRPPPLQGTIFEDSSLYTSMLADDLSQVLPCPGKIVAASDRNQGAIKATKANAKRAGVLDWMKIQDVALSSSPVWQEQKGKHLLVVTNPPFGKRISPKTSRHSRDFGLDDRQLLPLYQALLNLSQQRSRTRTTVFTSRSDLLKRAGWKYEELFHSMHGGIPVTAASCDSQIKKRRDDKIRVRRQTSKK